MTREEEYEMIENELRDADDQTMIALCERMIDCSKFGYFNAINRPNFKKLFDFIMHSTKFIDYDAAMSTRFWYVINKKKSLIRCHNPMCNKVIRKVKINPITQKDDVFYCCERCVIEDPYYKKKIGNSRRGKTAKTTTRNDIPPECNICWKDSDIKYDSKMNEKLKDFYSQHKKSFKFWIDSDVKLKHYLFEKSYPIDYTHLNLETRVFWVLNQMQKFPECQSCGRQIDFRNVKQSKGFPSYCCTECMNEGTGFKQSIMNRTRIYRTRVLTSPLTEPLFTEQFFIDNCTPHVPSDVTFKCRCKLCESEFEAKFDENFYARESNKQSFFRCKKCFPLLTSHKSKTEKELLNYVKEVVGSDYDVKSGDRSVIHPHELDVYIPSLNIAFEFNGVYWHSNIHEGCEEVQMLKMRKAESSGIKLMVVWEDEWRFDNRDVKDRVKRFIKNSKKLMADLYDMSKDIIEVDRSRFNKCIAPDGYQLIEETEPNVVTRRHVKDDVTYDTPDYGKLIYKRCS